MITFETMSFAMIILLFVVALFKMINDLRKKPLLLIPNVILGGGMYTILNLFGIPISINILTGALITMLGALGVCLIVILKVIFKIF